MKAEEEKCECGCGNNVSCILTVLGNRAYKICMNCHSDLTNLRLNKEQFKSLIKNGHITSEFLLHSDFYDKNGKALQPQ